MQVCEISAAFKLTLKTFPMLAFRDIQNLFIVVAVVIEPGRRLQSDSRKFVQINMFLVREQSIPHKFFNTSEDESVESLI